jgi:hypothetical protein
MPSAAADPQRLLALSEALAPLRDAARRGADEVLGHYIEVGDRETQAVLDGYLEQAADALREIDSAATDLAGRLRVASQTAPATEGRVRGSLDDEHRAAPKGVFG